MQFVHQGPWTQLISKDLFKVKYQVGYPAEEIVKIAEAKELTGQLQHCWKCCLW
jgi:hypothetical protein